MGATARRGWPGHRGERIPKATRSREAMTANLKGATDARQHRREEEIR
jgi:hypothetical protein